MKKNLLTSRNILLIYIFILYYSFSVCPMESKITIDYKLYSKETNSGWVGVKLGWGKIEMKVMLSICRNQVKSKIEVGGFPSRIEVG